VTALILAGTVTLAIRHRTGWSPIGRSDGQPE
jgi:hypothetical protein